MTKVETPILILFWINWLLGLKTGFQYSRPCLAILAVELEDLISFELDMQIDATTLYMDSKLVLIYIYIYI